MKRVSISANKVLLFFLAIYIQFGYGAFRIDYPLSIGIIISIMILLLNIPTIHGVIIPKQIIYMLVWLAIMFLEAEYIAPIIVGHTPRLLRIGYEAVYFLTLMIYMLTAYLTAELQLDMFFLRWIVYFASFNASLALISEVTQYQLFKKVFYLSGAGIRFQGIAVNPNDYMVQALVAIVYFLYSKREKSYIRYLALFCLFFSVFATGSKGGVFAAAFFILIKCYKGVMNHVHAIKEKWLLVCIFPVFLSLFIIIVFFYRREIAGLLSYLNISGMERIIELLIDPIGGFEANNSDRLVTWGGTLKVWLESPIWGVGIGGHKQILEYLNFPWAYETPHNIYLELLEQTGIIGMMCLGGMIGKYMLKYTADTETRKMLKGMFVILLLHGISTASDWAITFWIVVGLMLYHHTNAVRIHINMS